MQLSEIGGGALQEVFELELKKLLLNIRDPNTDAKAKRKITIDLSFKPNEKRSLSDMEFAIKRGEAPFKSLATSILIHDKGGENVEAEEIGGEVPGQVEIIELIKEETK